MYQGVSLIQEQQFLFCLLLIKPLILLRLVKQSTQDFYFETYQHLEQVLAIFERLFYLKLFLKKQQEVQTKLPLLLPRQDLLQAILLPQRHLRL